jgi:hypothetical protein
VANLKVRLGEYDIKQTGETEIFESKAARVVRHKEFSQQTLVSHNWMRIEFPPTLFSVEYGLNFTCFNPPPPPSLI